MNNQRGITLICLTNSGNRYFLSVGHFNGKINIDSFISEGILDASGTIVKLVNSVQPDKIVFDDDSYLIYKKVKRKFIFQKIIGARAFHLTTTEVISALVNLQSNLDDRQITLTPEMKKIFRAKLSGIIVDKLSPEISNILMLINSLAKCKGYRIPKLPIPGVYM